MNGKIKRMEDRIFLLRHMELAKHFSLNKYGTRMDDFESVAGSSS